MHQIVNCSALEEKEEKGSAKELLGHETKVHTTNRSNIFNHQYLSNQMDWETPNKVRKCQKVCWSSFFVIFCQSYGLFVWRLRLVSSCASLNVAQAMLGPSSDHPSFGLSRYHPAESETKGERWRKRRKRRKPNERISAISTHHLSISEMSPAFLGCESLTRVMQTCKHAKFNAKSLMLPNQLYDAVWQKYPLHSLTD